MANGSQGHSGRFTGKDLFQILIAVFGLILVTAHFSKSLYDYRRGNWQSTYGPMMLILEDDDGTVTGYFPEHKGRLYGRLTGLGDGKPMFEGFWVQPKSDRRCNGRRFGSHYWGTVTFSFSAAPPAKSGFLGFWGYCDAARTGKWNGEPVTN